MNANSRADSLAIRCGALAVLLHAGTATGASESIEFVGEHLAEIVMDNRYASLPLWGGDKLTAQGGFAQTRSGALSVDGLMVSFAAARHFAADWQLTGLVFFDDLDLASGVDRRPLEVSFTHDVPLSLPADAQFAGLSGVARYVGFGISVRRTASFRLWHTYEWTAGVLWQRVALRDYAFDFRILSGPDAGETGLLDYSATYTHITPFLGIAWPREMGHWKFVPHIQAAVPLPRRGVAGRIAGTGYDLRGDTGSAANDRPFGDPSMTLGFDLTYRPWNLTVDLGSVVSQAVLEPLIHEGVDRNWLISVSWNY